jgi:hypothetical protein
MGFDSSIVIAEGGAIGHGSVFMHLKAELN